MPKNSNSMGLTKFSAVHEAEVARRAINEEREAEIARQNRFAPVLEKIKFNRARGMSESQIIRIYGADVVQLERESRLGGESGEPGKPAAKTAAVLDPIPSGNLSAVQSRLPVRYYGKSRAKS